MSKDTRVHSLDSLRGIASLQVVFGHCLTALPFLAWLVIGQKGVGPHNSDFYIANSPIRVFWNAIPAVKVFFVLSGFVLSLPYYSNKEKGDNNYFSFFIKRIIRLYVPCLVIILISASLRQLLYQPSNVSGFYSWVKEMWVDDISVKEFINLLLLNTHFNNIDPALWTLPIEIKLSLILPLFIYWQKNLNAFWSIASVFIYVFVYHGLVALGITKIFPDLNNLFYFSFFLLGSILCKYRAEVVEWVNGLSLTVFWLILIVAIFLYTGTYSLWWLPGKVFTAFKQIPEDYRSAIPAVIFVAFTLSRRSFSLLNTPILLFIGKISFSLYLIHQVIIVTCVYLLSKFFSPGLIIIISFILSIGLATLYYRWVEVPSLQLAKRAAKYITNHSYYNRIVLFANKKS